MGRKDKFIVIVLFLIAIVLIVSSLFFVFTSIREKPLQSVEYDVKFEVSGSNVVGFDVNGTALVFGRTSPGGTEIIRPVVVDNKYKFPIRIETFVSENVAPALVLNSSYFVEMGNNLTIDIRLKVPLDFEYGNHTGKIRFELYEVIASDSDN